MDNVKPWQAILLLAGFGVLGVSIWFSGILGGGVAAQMGDEVIMMDVDSGELFKYSLKGRRGVMVPGENPNTGTLSLMPVYQDEQGRWLITSRDLEALQYVEVDVTRVDPSSGVASPVDESPTRVDN